MERDKFISNIIDSISNNDIQEIVNKIVSRPPSKFYSSEDTLYDDIAELCIREGLTESNNKAFNQKYDSIRRKVDSLLTKQYDADLQSDKWIKL